MNFLGNKRRPALVFFAGLLLCFALALPQVPAASEPMWVENLSPLAGLVGLPPQRAAQQASGWHIDTHLAVASHFVAAEDDSDSVIFDGETVRYSLALEYGWQQDWSLRLTVPWVSHGAGFLDSSINSWHNTFGLSDGGRAAFPQDQFRYQYSNASYEVSQFDEGDSMGDVRLELNRSLFQDADRAAALTLGYKAATGDTQHFTGSGAEDVFATLRYSAKELWQLPVSWHAQAGYTWVGTSKLLGPNQRHGLWFAGLGVDWRIAQRWSLLAQFDSHSGVLNSPVAALGKTSGLLSFGLRFSPNRSWMLEVGVIEDIIVETAPDVTFQASLRWRPKSPTSN